MTTDQKIFTSAQVREKHRKWLANRNVRPVGVLAEGVLPEPKIPDFWPGEPEFEGLVPVSQQSVDMLIRIPAWPNGAPDSAETDSIDIEWKKSADADWTVLKSIPKPGPNDPGDPDFEYTLPKENFADHGTYNLRYRIRDWNGENNSSITQNIIIDKIKPHNNGLSPDLLLRYGKSNR